MDISNQLDRLKIICAFLENNLHILSQENRRLLAPIEEEIINYVKVEINAKENGRGVLEVISNINEKIENCLLMQGFYKPNPFDIIKLSHSITAIVFLYDNKLMLLNKVVIDLPVNAEFICTLIYPFQNRELEMYLPIEDNFIDSYFNLIVPNNSQLNESFYKSIHISFEQLQFNYKFRTKFDFNDIDINNSLHLLYLCYIITNGNERILPDKILQIVHDSKNDFDVYIDYVKDNSISVFELLEIFKIKLKNKKNE